MRFRGNILASYVLLLNLASIWADGKPNTVILQEVVKLEINSTTTRNTFLLFLYRDTQVKLSCYNSACLQSQIKKPPVYMKSSNESLRGHFTQDNCRLPPVMHWESWAIITVHTRFLSFFASHYTLYTKSKRNKTWKSDIFTRDTDQFLRDDFAYKWNSWNENESYPNIYRSTSYVHILFSLNN